MASLKVATASPEETFAVARALGQRHPEGGIFYLEGDLGAGKTIFAKGLAAAYGVDPEDVVSPTFALVNRYSSGKRTVYHVDLYRIENDRELAELGLEEIEGEPGLVILVEWAEKLGRFRRPEAIVIRLETAGESTRAIEIIQLQPEERH